MSVMLSGDVSGWFPKTKIVVFKQSTGAVVIAQTVVDKKKTEVSETDFPVAFTITSQHVYQNSNVVFDTGRGLIARCDAVPLGS